MNISARSMRDLVLLSSNFKCMEDTLRRLLGPEQFCHFMRTLYPVNTHTEKEYLGNTVYSDVCDEVAWVEVIWPNASEYIQ